MTRARLFAVLLAILLPVGCGKKDAGLSGTYKGRDGVPAHDVTVTFQDDGTFESKSPAEVITGSYKLEGRKLAITVTEVNGEPLQFLGEPATLTLSDDGRSLIDANGNQHTRERPPLAFFNASCVSCVRHLRLLVDPPP